MVNKLLIDAVCSLAKKNPRHDQGTFIGSGIYAPRVPVEEMREGSCETTACLAGFAVLLTAPAGSMVNPCSLYDKQGDYVEAIFEYARDVMGLTDGQAEAVFFCKDETLAIKRLRYIGKRPDVTPEELYGRFPYFAPTED
jgi:hypothetical protein